jgi:hypothetical protein
MSYNLTVTKNERLLLLRMLCSPEPIEYLRHKEEPVASSEELYHRVLDLPSNGQVILPKCINCGAGVVGECTACKTKFTGPRKRNELTGPYGFDPPEVREPATKIPTTQASNTRQPIPIATVIGKVTDEVLDITPSKITRKNDGRFVVSWQSQGKGWLIASCWDNTGITESIESRLRKKTTFYVIRVKKGESEFINIVGFKAA